MNSIRNLKRRFTSFSLIFLLLLSFVAPTSASVGHINYLALGDSLAAGVTPNNTIDKGYADFTAEYLSEQNLLDHYSKNFAVPGDQTDDVLEDVSSNGQLREAIKNSNVITISAGANDLLSKVDLSKNPITYDLNLIQSTLLSVVKNYEDILTEIKELNSNAKVYVMGYYFAFPYISDTEKPNLIKLTQTLNSSIQESTTSHGATFVSVYEQFGHDAKQFLPNPTNIHPNLEGYKIMSEALLEIISNPSPNPEVPVAKDIPKGFWAEKELNLLLTKGLLQLDVKGNVYPGKAITRAEVANILFSSIPTTTSIPPNPEFKDVPQTHPSYLAIAKLTELGVFANNTNFNPDVPITRVQMAKVIAIAFHFKSNGSIPMFKDINAKYWGTPFISAMSSNKIMMGYSNGAFGINDITTRAQFAVIMVRVLNQKTSQ